MEEKVAAMEVEAETRSKAKQKLTKKTERYEIENVIRERLETVGEEGGEMKGAGAGGEGLLVRVEPGDRHGQDREGQEGEDRQTGEGDGTKASVRGRKRRRNEEAWKRNVTKRLRNSGRAYVFSRGKEIAGRAMTAGCSESCALICSTKLKEDETRSLFEEFWNTADFFLMDSKQSSRQTRK